MKTACSPYRDAYLISDLKSRWRKSDSEVRRWLLSGSLGVHVWLPVMSVYRRGEGGDGRLAVEECDLRHWEGYATISRHYCYRLLRDGQVRLREFECGRSGNSYVIPQTADDLVIDMGDLVVLDCERIRIEGTLDLSDRSEESQERCREPGESGFVEQGFVADAAFKIIRHGKTEYRMGDMQAGVLCELYRSGREGQPWQSGKQLLRGVGSQSFTLSNVFKRNPIWRSLVLSDGRGSYRLDSRRLKVVDF